jgi:hypothetical protein
MRASCRAIAHGGGPCQAPPLRDEDFCRMHSPAHAEAVADARRLGGQRRRRDATVATAYDFDGLHAVQQIRRVLEIGVLGALELENSLSRSRTLAYLSQVALRTLEVGELETRLADLEATLRQPPQRSRQRR